MQTVIVGLIVLSAYILIRLLARIGAWMSGARYRAYRQLAARYNGRYESRGISDTPTVSFNYHGSTYARWPAHDRRPTWADSPNPGGRPFQSGIPFRLELASGSRPRPAPATQGNSARKGR